MAVAIASDHAGLSLKEALVAHLRARGLAVDDLGPHDAASVDYPAFARPLAEAVAQGRYERGVLVCGTGMGMSIAANKVPGVRAALCTSELVARMARAHNDANVLCLGERVTGPGLALAIADAFLDTPFEGGRHQRRVDQITAIESAFAAR
jgi:ribose 5-phosphate isomerase B